MQSFTTKDRLQTRGDIMAPVFLPTSSVVKNWLDAPRHVQACYDSTLTKHREKYHSSLINPPAHHADTPSAASKLVQVTMSPPPAISLMRLFIL